MLILLIILLIVPPMLSVILYERFRGYTLPDRKRLALGLIFAFLINMIAYAFMWWRGWEYHSWALGDASSMTHISFVVKYMAITLVSAIIIPYIICLVRSKSSAKPDEPDVDPDISEQDVKNAADNEGANQTDEGE